MIKFINNTRDLVTVLSGQSQYYKPPIPDLLPQKLPTYFIWKPCINELAKPVSNKVLYCKQLTGHLYGQPQRFTFEAVTEQQVKELFAKQGSESLRIIFESLSLDRLEEQYLLMQQVQTNIMLDYSKTVYELKSVIFDQIQKLTFDLSLYVLNVSFMIAVLLLYKNLCQSIALTCESSEYNSQSASVGIFRSFAIEHLHKESRFTQAYTQDLIESYVSEVVCLYPRVCLSLAR